MSIHMKEYSVTDAITVVAEVQVDGNSGSGSYPRIDQDIEMVDVNEIVDVSMEEIVHIMDAQMKEWTSCSYVFATAIIVNWSTRVAQLLWAVHFSFYYHDYYWPLTYCFCRLPLLLIPVLRLLMVWLLSVFAPASMAATSTSGAFLIGSNVGRRIATNS
ncbi:hypothetical protein MAM1_0094c05008 [Mucor ambiguus]|uniref:Uncharacterized protein n=1 Tax=Mucor ambiguus TaxID=91626 RepID=A0A0C9MQG5_9FUNG|nr:hypothetical protein MAM1_0094c05008 [Mucor ambiguus]